ncbi:DNA-binding protein YbaB [Saccharopolyspora lacisalsi]|uniref:DNA-binding protein YbaB n=1 Tax=Halosaccharopolyspora lacisalsi TaxID=1000566 RepID=A0A839DUF9_9PSEU|nr:YbaB/EbfC family nucleoid-associated protein [Halosaccharopolyspora lacisalsi]MBA8825124.1 DNA-binding protein YbaB [Halosaccharopolyspora lacisalsi]
MPDPNERIQQMMQRFEQQAAEAAQVKDKMSELRGEARSQDGAVAVTVAPSGAVLDLQLSAGAMRQSHGALQQSIIGTIREATQRAAQQMDETVQPILGDRAEQFKEAFRAHGAEPVMPDSSEGSESGSAGSQSQSGPDSGDTARPNSRRPSWEDEDDDFGNNDSYLR